jgi:hypothetical protein
VAYAAALRITRFHTQNDHGDWDEVHHAFAAANALHEALRRSPSPALVGGVYHGALRIYLDRFLNIPAARLPSPAAGSGAPDLAGLQACWDQEGRVDDAGATRRRSSPSWAGPCSPRTPSSTGTRPTRPPSASTTPGRRAPRRGR